MANGSSSVTSDTDTDPELDLHSLSNRVRVLEQNNVSAVLFESYLRNRIRELERPERSLLLQLASDSHLRSMQHSQRLDQRLRMLKEEIGVMTEEKGRVEQVWRDRLQRCQRQLKAKEDEMSSQSQFFETFKTQLQQRLNQALDREQSLQKRVFALEKQLLDMTVSAATGTAAISAVRITANTTSAQWGNRERLPSMRGEGEGEEERNEDRGKHQQPSVGIKSDEREGNDVVTGDRVEAGRSTETERDLTEARLQGFILSLQEDLRVLLEREDHSVTVRRGLMEQLQEAQENNQLLSCKVEEMKAQVNQLKLSESSLNEEVEKLRQENHRLEQILRDVDDQTRHPGNSTLSDTCARRRSSECCSREVPATSAGELLASAIPPSYQQATAESTINKKEDHPSAKSTSLKNDFLNPGCLSSKTNLNLQPFSVTTDVLDEFKMGAWCFRGIQNIEENTSDESDALWEAYRDLGLIEDHEATQEQRESVETVVKDKQLPMDKESTLKLLRDESEDEEVELKQRTLKDGLVHALNQENRALAKRIQELLMHIKVREEEINMEKVELQGHITKLEVDTVRLEQENQEQGCLITELTKKTEDDLNTIMELQQTLAEGEQVVQETQGSQPQSEHMATVSQFFQRSSRKEAAEMFSKQQSHSSTTASSPVCHLENDYKPQQNSLSVNLLTDELGKLSTSIHNLQMEQEELSNSINSLRQQHKEVALSVLTQTEAKQQLTRTVWGLKEEKDRISQFLDGLKQEREQLTRTVRGLKNERDRYIRSTSDTTEEKELLIKTISDLKMEKENLLETLSHRKEERDQILCQVQSFKTEREQLNQTLVSLRQEKEELTNSLKCLKEQRDEEKSHYAPEEDRVTLMELVSTLREEKERIELSISRMKQEDKQVKLLQGQIKERTGHNGAQTSQTQTEAKREKLNLHPQSLELSTQSCHANRHSGTSIQEQSELWRELDALEAELKRAKDELDSSHSDTQRLQRELCHSEARREEAEKTATRASDEVRRLEETISRMEKDRKENDILIKQVAELHSKITTLLREKKEALSLKTKIQEQYNTLTSELKAKTVALEELNLEYINLKRALGSKDDLNTRLVSLRTQYSNIKTKYDALLKKRNQMDLDMAPLKAKLSCLVIKCQERNNLLAQMMKAMHRRGCADFTLTQQAEQLLRDDALQEYSNAFTPDKKSQGCSSEFVPESVFKFQFYPKSITHDVISEPLEEQARVQATQAPVAPGLNDDLDTTQPSFSVDGPLPTTSGHKNFTFHHPETERESSQEPNSLHGCSLCPGRPTASTFISSRKLSSPEKILDLHEQLQKTLSSSQILCTKDFSPSVKRLQTPANIGRGQEPRKYHSFSAPADLIPTPQRNKESLSFSASQTKSVTLSAAPSLPDKSATSDNADAFHSADLFTGHHFKNNNSEFHPKSPEFQLTTLKSTNSADSPPETTASDTAAPENNYFGTPYKCCNVKNERGRPLFAAACTPEKSYESERKSSAAVKKSTMTRLKPETPAQVHSLEVIKKVGQNSLLIAWERPPLDELGCSNGTFVYGYRVIVNGDFYKSVMSSACTKCVLEDLDLSFPVFISVQTLGSNGLSSDGVHTVFRADKTGIPMA